ncbi:MAG TPA: Rrf2 family transcriptional regulator [Bryobacteraceae bacterium]|jgi:Rrf2 family protein|nr:Rrf2 family transcriptional regulator [Bryobacteraceae bacterium]
MQLTRAADYAVRIMIHLATLPAGARPNRAALAEAGEIPEHFVGKVLQSLARARLIDSQRGMNGGYGLAVEPHRITMLEVIEAIEGTTQLNVCLAPGPSCGRKWWCPAHSVWVEAQDAMTRVLRRTTIGSLAAQVTAHTPIASGE